MKRRRSSVVRHELYRAVEEGNLHNVQDLVDQDADIHARFELHREVGGTVMHMAAYHGHRHLLAFFLNKGLGVNVTDTKRNTPLHHASRTGHTEVVQFLLNQNANMHAVNKLGQKPIHRAAWFGHKDVVEMFLKKGMNVHEADRNGSTLFHLSCSESEGSDRNLKLVQLLVNYKADIHAKDKVGQKPIHVAAAWGQKDVVDYFLELGMSVDETDQNGQTTLHLAAESGCLNVVQLLVDRIGEKPQLDAQDNEGKTPMHVCYRRYDIFNCLLDAGARSDIKDHDGRTVVFYYIDDCIRRNYYPPQPVPAKMHCNFVDIDDLTKMTAAHLVVKYPRIMDLIKLVLQHQKDLNVEDKNGETPMNYLTRDLSSSEINQQETLIRMFVDHGAYFKAEDCERIVQKCSLKKRLFTDKKFCSHYLVNKFDNIDLPMLGKLPSAIPLSVLEKLKLKSGNIYQIERAVEEEIRNKGHCDVSKMAPSLLSILAIESYISHYCTS